MRVTNAGAVLYALTVVPCGFAPTRKHLCSAPGSRLALLECRPNTRDAASCFRPRYSQTPRSFLLFLRELRAREGRDHVELNLSRPPMAILWLVHPNRASSWFLLDAKVANFFFAAFAASCTALSTVDARGPLRNLNCAAACGMGWARKVTEYRQLGNHAEVHRAEGAAQRYTP